MGPTWTILGTMPERPPAVRIDDLIEPRLPAELIEAMELVAPMADAIELTPEALVAAARAETGLEDFGDDLHVEPMRVLLSALATEAKLSPLGVVSQWASLVQHAKNKLLITDYVTRHPAVLDIEIERPIVIAGQGRTGTTHLHNLISADPTLRSLPYWESLEPVPPLDEQDRIHDVDPRYTRCADALAGLNSVLPHFKRMHDMYPEHVHEEIQLLAASFSTMLFETMAPMPTWRDHYLATDQTPYYAFLCTTLKVLAHQTGDDGRRWVLKSPQHVEQIGPLLRVFPDAIVVCTHRDPVAVTQSMATMLTYTARTSRSASAVADVGRYWIDRVELMFRHAVEQRELVPADQSMDVRFHEFMADDIAMVERIYALADQSFTPDVRSHMEAFMVEHPRGKYGSVRYDLGDFGVDRAERRRALQFYVDRFGVELEPV